ncbi:MAG TPA: phosphate acyltransferase, partial [Holophaga sp.]|nr:phosphate acyltransferase [Holophaga sp.]
MDWSVVLEAKARARKRTIVFPEGDNPIIREAAALLAGQGLLEPVLIQSRAHATPPEEASRSASPAEGPKVRPMDDQGLEAFAAQLCAERDLPLRICRRMVAQPLLFAAMMVRNGEADGMVAGIDCPTGEVILAGGMGIGLRQGMTIPSSFYVMDVPGFEGSENGCLV